MPTLEEIHTRSRQQFGRTTVLGFEPNEIAPMTNTLEDIAPTVRIKINPEQETKRAKRVFDFAAEKEISLGNSVNAYAEKEMTDFVESEVKFMEEQGVFDPIEPPNFTGAGIASPYRDILDFYLNMVQGGGKVIGTPIERLNKFITGIWAVRPMSDIASQKTRRAITWTYARLLATNNTFGLGREAHEKEFERIKQDLFPELQEKLDISLLSTMKEMPISWWQGIKAAIPWPGTAKDSPTFGDALADTYYKTMTGQKAPFYYAPVVDVAAETIVLGGALAFNKRMSARIAGQLKSIYNGRLTKSEIQQASRVFTRRQIARMQPREVRIAIGQDLARKQAIEKLIQSGAITETGTAPIATRPQAAIDKLTSVLKKTKPVRRETEILKHRELGKRVAKAKGVLESHTGEAKEAFLASQRALAGELPRAKFEPPRLFLAPGQENALYSMIRSNPDSMYFQNLDTAKALRILLDGDIPTRGQIKLLEQQFGTKLAKVVLAKRPIGEKAIEATLDILNLPKAVVASFDMSAPFRQGIILLPGHPKSWLDAFGKMVKAAVPFKGEEYARRIEYILKFGKNAGLRRQAGLYQAPLFGVSPTLATREEAFMSQFARYIPGLKWSERNYVTFLNQLRTNIFDDIVKQWERAGRTISKNPKAYKDLARFINHATGRGDLGALGNAGPWLNAAFFSPRYQTSRIQMPIDLLISEPAVRRVIARDLVAFAGTGLSVLTLAHLAGAEVETNPISSDFGKIKYGNTRYDFWAGNQQIARLVAQFIRAERKSTGTGRISDAERNEILVNYLEMKLSPTAGLAVDILRGRTAMGDELTTEVKSMSEQAYNRLTPLFIQDTIDAIRFQGLDGSTPISAGAAFFGVGVQTWEPSKKAQLYNIKDELARETFGKGWDDLDYVEFLTLQNDIMTNQPGILELEREAEFETQMYNLDLIAREQQKTEKEITKSLTPQIKTSLEEIKVRTGAVSRIVGDWRLNDKLFGYYKQIVSKYINDELTQWVNTTGWDNLKTESKRGIAEDIIASAKERAKGELKIGIINKKFKE